jgi:hypothetical protein
VRTRRMERGSSDRSRRVRTRDLVRPLPMLLLPRRIASGRRSTGRGVTARFPGNSARRSVSPAYGAARGALEKREISYGRSIAVSPKGSILPTSRRQRRCSKIFNSSASSGWRSPFQQRPLPRLTFPSIGRAQSPRNTERWVLAVTGTARGYGGTGTCFWIDRRLEFRSGARRCGSVTYDAADKILGRFYLN